MPVAAPAPKGIPTYWPQGLLVTGSVLLTGFALNANWMMSLGASASGVVASIPMCIWASGVFERNAERLYVMVETDWIVAV